MLNTIRPYRWLVVTALWCVCFLNYADRQAIFSLFPLLKSDFALSALQLGIVGSCFSWMYALFGPVAGWLGDRWPRRWLVYGGLLVWILLAFSTSIAKSYPELILLRSLSGLSEAFYFPAAMSLISSFHGPATRSRAMSIHQSAVYVGSIGGGTLAGVLGQEHGWRSSFRFFGMLGLAVAVGVVALLRDPPQINGDKPGPMRFIPSMMVMLSNRRAMLLVLVFMGANFVALAFMTWLPTFLHAKFAMGIALAGVNGSLYLQLASVGGVIVGGLLADKLVNRYPGGRMLTQAIALMAGVPFLFFAGWVRSLGLFVVTMVGFGFCKGIYDSNIFAALYDLVPREQRATAAGLMNSLGWLGGGFAPVALAFGSSRFGMSACLSATSAIYLTLSMILFINSTQCRSLLQTSTAPD